MRKIIEPHYQHLQTDIAALLRQARTAAVRSVNAVMTASYWEVGRRIVEAEQKGKHRAAYGEQLILQLAVDLTAEFGRGFSDVNLRQMRRFHLAWSLRQIQQTLSAEFTPREKNLALAASEHLTLADLAHAFPLPWSAYVCLLSVESEDARTFYEQEALRGGWSVRQLKRQIDSQFYERSLLSKNKKAMLSKGAVAKAEDAMSLADIVKDPYVLEFLDLKDEEFSHADAGQMHMYLNYAKAHWMVEGENPPVGIILCSQKGAAQAHYALEGLPNKVLAARYQTLLPSAEQLTDELRRASAQLAQRGKA
jgi:DUF1016 N-terminal domain/YhcG PDDEXK nuclease domain